MAGEIEAPSRGWTQVTSGPIDISTSFDVAKNHNATLEFSIAKGDVGGLLTGDSEVLHFAINGTLTGFGTSKIMVPVLVFLYLLPQTLFLVIIHWFGDIWKMLLFRSGIRWRL
jgi:hypothetical protein